MSEADDTSTTMSDPPGRVPDCAARLGILYQIRDEKADDPDEDDALVSAWNAAEWDAIEAMVAAPGRTFAEPVGKGTWLARLAAVHDPDCHMTDWLAALARDARALAAGAR